MKVLCDVHISIRVAKYLSSQGIEAYHVNQLPDKWETSDAVITQLADEQDLIVISKDVDFRNSFLLKQRPRKLLHVCVGNASNDDLIKYFAQHLESLKKISGQTFFYLELNPRELLAIVVG